MLTSQDEDRIIARLAHGDTVTHIASDYSTSRYVIYKSLSRRGIRCSQSLKFDHNYFASIDREDKAYWLGFIMADGCISLTQSPKLLIHLQPSDRDHLEKFHHDLRSCIRIHDHGPTANSPRGGICSAHYSRKLTSDLIALGCVPRKSLTLRFPEVDPDLSHHVVRGYFDGDGCIRFRQMQHQSGYLAISILGTEHVLMSIKQMAGVTSNVRPRRNQFVLDIGGSRVASSFGKWMYRDAITFLERKKAIFDVYCLR